jgi:hypothetical protein
MTALTFKFKGKGHMGQPRTRSFSQVLETSRKDKSAGKKSNSKGCRRREEIEDFWSNNPYKMEIVLEK